jgi:hypothetical protein
VTAQQRAAALAAMLAGLPDAGVANSEVQLYREDWGRFIEQFAEPERPHPTDGKPWRRINGWEVSRTGLARVDGDWVETYSVRKYTAISDEPPSQPLFTSGLDAAARLFLDQDPPFGIVLTTVQFASIGEALFGRALCHLAEGTLSVLLHQGEI